MLDSVLESEKIRELKSAFQNLESVLIEDLWNTPKALIATLAARATGKHILIITGSSQEEARLHHDFGLFAELPIIEFPAWETLPGENIPPSPDIVGERYRALHDLKHSSQPHIVLTSLQAALQRLIKPKRFSDLYLSLVKGDVYAFDKLIVQLQQMGYEKYPLANDKGQYAVRGSIIDIYPVSSPDPFRIEFWGDDIESIRIYDPIGQKSVKQVERVDIAPAKELEMIKGDEPLCTILDYLGEKTIIIYDDLLALEDRYASLVGMITSPTKTFCTIHEFLESAKALQTIFWSKEPIEELSEVQIHQKGKTGYYSQTVPMLPLSFQIFDRTFSALRWAHPFLTVSELLLPTIEEPEKLSGHEVLTALGRLPGEWHLYVLSAGESEENTFRKRIHDAAIHLPKNTHYQMGYLSSGMAIADTKTLLFPMTEVTRRYKIRRQKQRSTYHTDPIDSFDLSPGEMIVHYNNGIGRYLGVEKLPDHQGVTNEFFHLEYADSAKLYVPLNQAHLITKYIGASEETPKMHTIGGTRWKAARQQAERSILGYAKEILELYARRELADSVPFAEDSHEMHTFEEEFPYVETEDQLAAIAGIKKDLCSRRPMDRLICGDVGYGKTEVAMRAAFKAVVDGKKQVAILVPTTVLAMQHFENFCDRFSNFPINIAVLSRFRTAKQVKESLQGIAAGSVDIVIGTHRVISEDVAFKDLGLIIIDEEQRFGVKAKEHLKKIKVGAHCLTLSATPIPRTLYMSLSGARDMSVINTPPQDRLPISTVITENNDVTIKNALLRELARDGQAYIIHNRVETIFDFASHIQKLLPKTRIVVGHGQMSSHELDVVFHAFKSGQADILVATTIVENGIDIPNANTILIDRADTFGIADLYQLRGRVGRWNRRAYALLFIRRQRELPELVQKRLKALAESSGYGGGMKVAMRDLEIRGAGNILGTEQSGQVSSIGFHLYCKMLKRTVLTMQGKIPAAVTDTKVEIKQDAKIPEEYVKEASLRMEIYQRFGEAIEREEIDAIWAEIQDRFGPPPEPAVWLYHLTRVRAYAACKGCTLIKQEQATLRIERKLCKETSVKKFLFSPPKTAQEMEKKIIAAIGE